MMPQALQYAAFTDDSIGGNPAGVVLDADGLNDADMLALAASLGHSETAFLQPLMDRDFSVRYFSPAREVPFCGHATIASAVALGERMGAGALRFHTAVGEVPVDVRVDHGDALVATLTSVAPQLFPAPNPWLAEVLEILGWSEDELDSTLPPRIAYAGARHLVLAAATRDRLRRLDYDFQALKRAMQAQDLITVALVWREAHDRFHARNPFPVGGVVEDPATGAAAAAFGGYLRELGIVKPPASITIHQGHDMGRPSRIDVRIGASGGIEVSGRATVMPA